MSPSTHERILGTSPLKIGIKGFSLSAKSSSSLAAGSRPAQRPTSSLLGKRGRTTFTRGDDSDSETEHGRTERTDGGRHEAVVGFGSDGAIRREEKKAAGPLVIPRMKNRDWRGEARAKQGKNLLPPEVQAAREAAARQKRSDAAGKTEGIDIVNGKDDAEMQWGLTVKQRDRGVENDVVVAHTNVENGVEDISRSQEMYGETKSKQQPPEEQTDDHLALEALIGISAKPKRPDLVIPIAVEDEGYGYNGPVDENDAYRRAIKAAPDVSTLEDYERVPVEEFGAALLRGMGWKGEKQVGPKEVKRRQNLLGLGAKELKDAEELGAWVQKSDIQRLKGSASGSRGNGERRPRASEYRREKERREERRDERHGGGYRRERERDSYREREREREREGRR